MILQPSQIALPNSPTLSGSQFPTGRRVLQPSQIAPQPTQPNQVPQEQPQGPQLSDTGSFGGNVVNSGKSFLGNLGNAILHPIDTVTNIGKGLLGAGENLGAELTSGKTAAENGKGDQFTQVADNIGHYVTQRYGSLEAAKKTAWQDPIGFLADASSILSGAGEAAGAVGATDTGNILSKAGEFTNPVELAAKGVGTIIKPITNGIGSAVSGALGTTTGGGATSVKSIFNAAMDGDSQAMDAVRGKIGSDAIVDTARTALDNLTAQKNSTYAAQLEKIKSVPGEMDYQPIVDSLKSQIEKSGITLNTGDTEAEAGTLNFENARGFQNPGEQAVLQNVYDKLQRWGDVPSNTTLAGLDALKQQLGDFYEQSSGKSSALIADVKNKLSTILKGNDEYKNLVEPYETTTNTIKEMKAEILSKDPARMGTALRRLTKAVSQDNDYKTSLINELNKTAPEGTDLQRQLSGLNMSSWTNKSKLSNMLEVAPVILHPTLWPTLMASSPRLVAEFMNALGYTSKQASAGIDLLKQIKPVATGNAAARINTASQPAQPSLPKAPPAIPRIKGIKNLTMPK